MLVQGTRWAKGLLEVAEIQVKKKLFGYLISFSITEAV
jgi:hypothetical protein